MGKHTTTFQAETYAVGRCAPFDLKKTIRERTLRVLLGKFQTVSWGWVDKYLVLFRLNVRPCYKLFTDANSGAALESAP